MRSKRDGIKSTDWRKHSNKSVARVHNKKVRASGKKDIQSLYSGNKEIKPSQKNNITNFIKNVSDGNYAQSYKYLQSVVSEKISQRIAEATEKPIFN